MCGDHLVMAFTKFRFATRGHCGGGGGCVADATVAMEFDALWCLGLGLRNCLSLRQSPTTNKINNPSNL